MFRYIITKYNIFSCQGKKTLWGDGMPMTVSYLSVPNDQQPAKWFQKPVDQKEQTNFIPTHMILSDEFALEKINSNGSCFVWSTNVLMFDTWLQFNCSFKISQPFIVCEKKLNINQTRVLFKRPKLQCTAGRLDFNGYCMGISKHIDNRRILNSVPHDILKIENPVLKRILTAWTMALYTGQKRTTIYVVNRRFNHNCECYTSIDIMYMENKTWYNDKSCSCSMRYPTLTVVSPKKTLIPKHLYSCEDGNFRQATYRCDGNADCHRREDERNCFHICSTPPNCIKGCTIPDCICTQMYHQCTLGGCVHQTFVCDGIVHCAADDSDELMCLQQYWRTPEKRKFIGVVSSFCNIYRNETYPNNEICLLTRNQNGITKHCRNTEHLRFCIDFRCPNYYKCLESYCIPLHLVCDGIKDCPTGQDESHCSEFACQGYYKCKGQYLCVDLKYLCDGVVDCPMHRDDEQYCDKFLCPKDCECIGFTVTCTTITRSSLQSIVNHKNRKAIVVSGDSFIINGAKIQFKNFPWLLMLNLSGTRFVQGLQPGSFTRMPLLRVLDLTNVNIRLDRWNRFTHMESLKHLYLIRSAAPRLHSNTFQLPNLMCLYLQHSEIQYIENRIFCPLSNLKLLNLSTNKIKHISIETFNCLNELHSLDISNNQLTTIAESAFHGISSVWFSRHITLCCYLNPTTSCQVDKKTISSLVIQNQCQHILAQHTWLKVIYILMGATSTLLSIIFMITMLLNIEKKNKSSRFIRIIVISDALNGIYLLTVYASDMINEHLAYKIAQRINLLYPLYYVSALPNISIIITRFEHVLMTVGMYIATCHIFLDFELNNKVARLVLWTIGISYCVGDIVLLGNVSLGYSLIWQPYQTTDFNLKNIVSIVLITGYELTTTIINIYLCTCIFKSVARIELRMQTKRLSKRRYAVAKNLIHLTVGRAALTLSFVSLIVLLRFELGLSTIAKQVLIAFGVPSSTIVHFVMFYNYG